MVRANINFIWQEAGKSPRTFFHFWLDDQSPSGLRDRFNLLSFAENDWTPENFAKWVRENYKQEPMDLGLGGQPRIYYTNGFVTHYSYVFEIGEERALVWKWAELVFKGNKQEFIDWLKKQA